MTNENEAGIVLPPSIIRSMVEADDRTADALELLRQILELPWDPDDGKPDSFVIVQL